MIRLSQLPWGLAAALLAAVHVSAGPAVNVGMKAAFSSAPYLIELLETAAGENSTCYFPLLDRIAEGDFSKASTDQELYEKFLQVLKDGGHISSPEALSSFKLALSIRSAAPRIEAHYQYYTTAVEPHLGGDHDQACDPWIYHAGRLYCSPELAEAGKRDISTAQDKTLPFDRSLGLGNDAILYADLTSPAFGKFHKGLAAEARAGKLRYRLRYHRSSGHIREPLPVSGYGVELALKRTDYIVIDDREATPETAQRVISADVDLDGQEEVADLKALSKSELASLGIKTGSFIMQSENPFETLIKLTQDFPKYSTALAAHNTSHQFKSEHEENRKQLVPSGVNAMWLNGVQLIDRQIEPFNLVGMLRRERKLINGVQQLGLTGQQAVRLLGHDKVAAAKGDDEPLRFDWRDASEDGRVIIWLNDLEKDDRYVGFPGHLMSLLQRSHPGQIPPIRKDIFNLIVPVDFSDAEDIEIVASLWSFVNRLIPIRFGVVPLVKSEEAAEQAKLVYYLVENYGVDGLISYLDAAHESKKTSKPDEALFSKIVNGHATEPEATPLPFKDVLTSEVHSEQVKLANKWARRLGADGTIPPIFIDGFALPRDENWMQAMSMKVSVDLQMVQQGIYMGMIDEDMWIPGIFLEKAVPGRNVYIYPEDEKSLTVLDVNKLYSENAALFENVPVLEAYAESTKENWAVLTVIADLSTKEGLGLLLAALQFRRNNPGVRLDVLHNPRLVAEATKVNTALKASEAKLPDVETVEELQGLLVHNGDSSFNYETALGSLLAATGFESGAQMLLLNGRVIGPITAGTPFLEEDFQQLLEFEQSARILPVYAAMDDLSLTEKLSGPLVAAKLTSITALSTISELPEGIFESAPQIRTTQYEAWNSTHTAIEVGDLATANIHLVGLLNPASEQCQRWAPVLKVLAELDGIYMKLFLNPKDSIDELPVKRFFRYVLHSEPTFDDSGKVKPLTATFNGVPSEALLTLGMDVPPAWLVAAKVSVHDLDNIKLSSVKTNVEATYELEHILIEGHSREGKGQPPRGAQLVLGTEKQPHLDDTIIMANLGYFQFKSNPGVYDIQLKEGRSSEIYTIESAGARGWQPVLGDEGTLVTLMEFTGTTLYPRLTRKPGMEKVDVLEGTEDDQDGGNIVSRGLKFAEGLFGGAKAKVKSTSDEEHAEINIFSVASGHLYERMLNIMMVSVMRHTNHTVKFWFIEQFLSPSFKDFIPHMAAEYGFKYEMVTYKWPHWLRQQKEKQREIWGYKILFLDVLFPLSLDKVIFVDADQIVRTDMMELVRYDLKGAPYGFTPMCDSRVEMEGFRFWKQGYWKNYLRGLPYHISALYVVDLRRFRELASGDRLRQQYHTLSADPASLANLDQDLPNHMQFVIPIHSLPQEWLWCETWCSDESLREAKTIDLCNNPQTKEPKLDRARRQVPEWTVYDDEIAAVDRRRKGLPAEAKKEEKNTKSRTLEEPVHTKDEL